MDRGEIWERESVRCQRWLVMLLACLGQLVGANFRQRGRRRHVYAVGEVGGVEGEGGRGGRWWFVR